MHDTQRASVRACVCVWYVPVRERDDGLALVWLVEREHLEEQHAERPHVRRARVLRRVELKRRVEQLCDIRSARAQPSRPSRRARAHCSNALTARARVRPNARAADTRARLPRACSSPASTAAMCACRSPMARTSAHRVATPFEPAHRLRQYAHITPTRPYDQITHARPDQPNLAHTPAPRSTYSHASRAPARCDKFTLADATCWHAACDSCDVTEGSKSQ
eukprot:6178213-Pleurochrysis_carterae.AAC.2